MDPSDPAYKGQKAYGPALLAVYDWWVLGFMARWVWRSSTPAIIERYRPLFGRRHLDIGPGSGYCIDVAAPEDMELTLLDPNRHVLDHCARRLARFKPAVVEGDVLKPLPVRGPFDSIALSFVLHCLPGPTERKATAIENAASVLDSEGVLFGGTVLGIDEQHSAAARLFLRAFNREGGFDNLGDRRNDLEAILSGSFDDVELDVVGSLALFTARKPRRQPTGEALSAW
jgi:ubiquinone/menaquinone biosynthesis C-methylase UbiE